MKLDAEGKKVVDADALWNNDPEAYLRWNDSQNGGDTEDSREMLSAVIAKREAEKQALKERKKAETVPSVRQNLQTQIANLDAQISMYGGFLAEYEEEARKAEAARQEAQNTEAEQTAVNSEQTEQKAEQNAVEAEQTEQKAEQTEQTSAQKSEDEGSEGSEVSEGNTVAEQEISAESEKEDGIEIIAKDENAMSVKITKDESLNLIQQMDAQSEVAPKLELTADNWVAQFGEDGIVKTPIGEVKMGENQYLKLAQQGRDGKLGMIKPTLQTPDVILSDVREDESGKGERASSLIFIKTFRKENGERYYHFTSVTVSKNGLTCKTLCKMKESIYL